MSLSVDGKWAEKQASTWLDNKVKVDATFAFHRYPDAKAARGALAAQPSDYIIGRKLANGAAEACHLEVKETAELNRLPKAKISQYGKLKLFDWAGFRTIVLVYRSKHSNWVYFNGRDIFDFSECPSSFDMRGHTTFPTAEAALSHIFPPR